MTLLDSLRRAWPVHEWADTTVVAAVSGGADSVALLLGVHALKNSAAGPGRIIVAHFNHRLRGAESDADESFVEELTKRLGVGWEAGRAAVPQDPLLPDDIPSVSEDASRRARYDFLKQTALHSGARFVATAHTADDQAETILHRIVRGTGIDGLAGIPRVREFTAGVTLIRPFLTVWRKDVLEFLGLHSQPFRQDASNLATSYTRNRLRHELLPQLEKDFNPRIRESLCRLGALAGEVSQLVAHQVDKLLESARVRGGHDEWILDCKIVADVDPYLIRQLLIKIWETQQWPLRDMSFEKWMQLADMTSAHTPARTMNFPGDIGVERDGIQLTIRRRSPSQPDAQAKEL